MAYAHDLHVLLVRDGTASVDQDLHERTLETWRDKYRQELVWAIDEYLPAKPPLKVIRRRRRCVIVVESAASGSRRTIRTDIGLDPEAQIPR